MSETVIALLLRADTGRMLLSMHSSAAVWDLPWRVMGKAPVSAAQWELARAFELDLPIEFHGSIQIATSFEGQSILVQILRCSSREAVIDQPHRWVHPGQLAEFAQGPILASLWQQGHFKADTGSD